MRVTTDTMLRLHPLDALKSEKSHIEGMPSLNFRRLKVLDCLHQLRGVDSGATSTPKKW